MAYLLPSHSSLLCSDPLSLAESNEPTVWEVIEAAINAFRSSGLTEKSITLLPELLDTLSYSIHGKGTRNSHLLVNVLMQEFDPTEALRILDGILNLALCLPNSFGSGSIQTISLEHPQMTLTESELSILIAHQALGTLTPPQRNTWGCNLSQWYSEPQALPRAIRGYVLTMLHFFNGSVTRPVSYELITSKALSLDSTHQSWANCALDFFNHLTLEPISTRTVQFPHKSQRCQLVAANKEPGFGSSCTQEELVTAACPALLPLGAILLASPIPADGVLVVRGAAPVSCWEGQGRDARMTGLADFDAPNLTLLLMDALEFDQEQSDNGIPDLIPENLLRELTKAYTGFQALYNHGILEVACPLWGTGAFNGDPVIKAIILAMAAAKAQVQVYLAVDEERSYTLPSGDDKNLYELLTTLQQQFLDTAVGDMWDVLAGQDPLSKVFKG